MYLVLIILLIVIALGGLPAWGYHSYGWGPSGVVLIVVIILLVWLVAGGRFHL
jgi:Protein of unknown function (DUF3309)